MDVGQLLWNDNTWNHLYFVQMFYLINYVIKMIQQSPCSVVDKVLIYDLVVSEFDLQSLYYVHFRAIPVWKIWTLFTRTTMI